MYYLFLLKRKIHYLTVTLPILIKPPCKLLINYQRSFEFYTYSHSLNPFHSQLRSYTKPEAYDDLKEKKKEKSETIAGSLLSPAAPYTLCKYLLSKEIRVGLASSIFLYDIVAVVAQKRGIIICLSARRGRNFVEIRDAYIKEADLHHRETFPRREAVSGLRALNISGWVRIFFLSGWGNSEVELGVNYIFLVLLSIAMGWRFEVARGLFERSFFRKL